jgi:lysophospholipase L1-like esterase
MNKKNLKLLTAAIAILLVASAIVAYSVLVPTNKKPAPELIRIACVGDSLTQGSAYPYELWQKLGRSGPFTIGNYTESPIEDTNPQSSNDSYAVGNFGAGGTMVTLKSETPYMNTSEFQRALELQPDIVIIMLGTNDAQPRVHQYNASFVDDYKTLINAFKAIESEPKAWIVLPPPIFDDQGGKTSPEYFEQIVIPYIEQASNEANLPVIDVHSVLANYPEYFPDGLHPDEAGGQLIANEIYKAIFS